MPRPVSVLGSRDPFDLLKVQFLILDAVIGCEIHYVNELFANLKKMFDNTYFIASWLESEQAAA